MLDHLGIFAPKARFEEVVNFYLAALAPLGYSKQMEFPGVAGLGTDKMNVPFWIGTKEEEAIAMNHIGFNTTDHSIVDKFYEEGIKAGGKDNGKPGLRTMYHPKYYAAFMYDPLGNNVEVVDHGKNA